MRPARGPRRSLGAPCASCRRRSPSPTESRAGLQLPLGEGILIGRASDCQLLLDDDYVSTRHARISRTPTGYQVEDLGSTNGTFVNNQRVTAPTPFGIEDTLRIGRTMMSAEK